jgi:branched-subunit amino acid transport protein
VAALRIWLSIALLAAATVALRAAGPVVLGGRMLPRRLQQALVVLPAAMLTALIVTQTFAHGRSLVLDARAAGIAVAIAATLLRRRMLTVVLLAAAATALLRLGA